MSTEKKVRKHFGATAFYYYQLPNQLKQKKTIKNLKNQVVIGSCTLAVILLVMVATATGSVLKRRTARRRQADAAATNPPSADRRSVLWTRFFPSGDSLGTASPTGLEVSAC